MKRRQQLGKRRGFRHGPVTFARSFRLSVVDGECVMAGTSVPCSGPFDACHVIGKRTLRNHGFAEDVVYDPRNGVCACRRHHRRNDDLVERFPVPESAREFAAEIGMGYYLERFYP